MSPHRLRIAPFLTAALVALSACGDGPGGDSTGRDGDEAARARYSRQMIFVASDATGAAVLEFASADVGSVVRRTARGWAEAGSGWTPLYDLAWEGIAVRRPWRLVPHGPIRLRVGLNDEVEAIAVRDQDTDLAVLETGDFVAEWAPFRTTQVILREATLALGGEPMSGWLIDARFGAAAQAPDDSTDDLAPNGDESGDGVAPAAEMPQQDSAAPQRTATDSVVQEPDEEEVVPIPAPAPAPRTSSALAVRSLRGVLVGPDGETLVIAETETGLGGWLWTEDEETTLPIVTLTAVEGEREAWTIEAGGGATLSGSLTVMDEEPMPLSPRIVRGTIEIDGDDVEMHGVLRAEDPVN